MGNCINCQCYASYNGYCHRFPKMESKHADDWCLEFKEVVVCPVEEKAKVEEVKVEEKVEVSEIIKRGWPKGKPRKQIE